MSRKQSVIASVINQRRSIGCAAGDQASNDNRMVARFNQRIYLTFRICSNVLDHGSTRDFAKTPVYAAELVALPERELIRDPRLITGQEIDRETLLSPDDLERVF